MNYTIFPNVRLGKNVYIGDYVILGLPPAGKKGGEVETIIGDNAVIRSHTVIYAGNLIGDNFHAGHHVMVREENIIGNNVSIGTGTIVEHHVILENYVRVHSQAFIPEFSILEEGAWIGPNVVITNALYPFSPGAKDNLKGACIKKNAKVGANSTLLPGIVLGENCLIGAGSVVTKDVHAGTVVAGNPAGIINEINNLPY
ncbi:dTDP-3-amino-3,6-dideoxy-alpha-D-galactopyranose 3-N-acetyltransferase [Pelotomaculum schinkii]|uniref:dTDP-3-amino-3,6-dideoxy-alpha-D-galactopyranose 3-N-acetyltransferase n=1 Tax=Pelotomaculum schinkii TaxID=78350 RepID=A0A4Y7RCQ8_9FIRM|nr:MULTISPECIES: acyltransferase [Pelotomaculum]TEB06612.1 dTDP-3-amino-3,6-dideoxy-alpha-D-galactopyranose 3-N-acetyltransferase [Pelotomaculum schinkii]TEB17593.1 dTDP-3-amino-3,6-dideoxy-alpha-D-galactopyranose 3-N-acetyltransferase [Pelotomaculum sp. FP]